MKRYSRRRERSSTASCRTSAGASVEAHLESCESCRETVREWRAIGKAAAAVGEPEPVHWEPVWSHIEAAAARRRSAVRMRYEIRKGFVAAAMAAAVLVAAYYFVPGKPVMSTVAEAPAAVQTVDIEVAPDYASLVMADENSDTTMVWVERI